MRKLVSTRNRGREEGPRAGPFRLFLNFQSPPRYSHSQRQRRQPAQWRRRQPAQCGGSGVGFSLWIRPPGMPTYRFFGGGGAAPAPPPGGCRPLDPCRPLMHLLNPVRGLSEHSIRIRGGSTRSTGGVRFPGRLGGQGCSCKRRFRRTFRVSDRPGGGKRDFRTCSQLARISSRPSSALFGRKRRLLPLPF